MALEEKDFYEITSEQFENEDIVNDITKPDHWLLVCIGILPFVIATIWNSIII